MRKLSVHLGDLKSDRRSDKTNSKILQFNFAGFPFISGGSCFSPRIFHVQQPIFKSKKLLISYLFRKSQIF